MKISDWITLAAVIVALFGPYLFAFVRRCFLEKKYEHTLSTIIKDFIFDLERIKTQRNLSKTQDSDIIVFDDTSRSEMFGYYDIFESLILQNYHLNKKGHADIIFLSV